MLKDSMFADWRWGPQNLDFKQVTWVGLMQIGPKPYFEENQVGVWLKWMWISSRDLNKEKKMWKL